MGNRPTKLTRNSGETDIAEMLSYDSIFSIPYFQRPYKWKNERIKQFNSDILKIVDQTSDSHFLGAIIIHGKGSNPSEPTPYDVIDGQQRITTIFLTIISIIKCLTNENYYDEATSLFQKYISIGRNVNALSNVKLHPCKEDRKQMNGVIRDILKDSTFKDRVGTYLPRLFPDNGQEKGPLLANYRFQCKFLQDQFKQGGIDLVRQIYNAIFKFISIVQIDVFDPTNGPKIFDSLNSRQEPMTIGDLVRNEIFSKVSNQSSDIAEQLDSERWRPFYEKFVRDGKNYFDSYFFPYGLVYDPNLAKSEVYGFLRDRWKDIKDPNTIIDEISGYQDHFLDMMFGEQNSRVDDETHKSVRRLYELGAPTSSFPFFMQFLKAIEAGGLDKSVSTEIFSYLEAFFVRRAVVGIEPTGLHAVFKRLWLDMSGDITHSRLAKEIRKHSTVIIPTDDQVKTAIHSRNLYSAGITIYLMRQYDLSLGADVPSDVPWIEHVLPQTMSDEWAADFTEEAHRKYIGVFANLIPLSAKMNMSLSNKPFELKRAKIIEDTMFKSARKFAADYDTWTQVRLEARSNELADWVVGRWPSTFP